MPLPGFMNKLPDFEEKASSLIHVAAGIIRDESGRVLLSQRPEGKHLAGTWEFPGGKCEPGESWSRALERELHEELGIQASQISPYLTLTHAYCEHTVRLVLLEVGQVGGRPHGREGQALRWVEPTEMKSLEMPCADRPIVKALNISPHYAISPDPGHVGGIDAVLDWAESALAGGMRLLQLRAHSLAESELVELAWQFGRLAHDHGASWLLNGPARLALELGADGVHLTTRALMSARVRPLPEEKLVIASCHDRLELAQAGAIGVDMACVSPVAPTASHPQAEPLGWTGLAKLCELAPVPIFALGGMLPDDLQTARSHGAFGVAGIRRFVHR